MAIPYLSAREIELALTGWPDGRFVALCNALIWAYAGKSSAAVSAAFTEREKAPDQGVDADLWIQVVPDQKSLGPFLREGWNVFQYKRRDVVSDRLKVVSRLRNELAGAVGEVAGQAGRCPSSYTLFTNVHFTRTQAAALKKVIEGSLGETVAVKVNGAAEMAAMLADLPHIRAAFFGAPRFETWQQAWDRLRRVKLGGIHVELVGRDKELVHLRQLVSDSSVRVILVHGPHDVGKDRLILEATQDRKDEILVATDPEAPDRRDIQEIAGGSRDALLIVEDVDRERLLHLLPQVLGQDRVKLVCSIPMVAQASLPNYGLDARVQSFPLGPLGDSDSEKLLRLAGATFDYALRYWVIQRAGGIPGLLLLAVSLGGSLRETTENFFERVGQAFELRVRNELGGHAVSALQVLSLLTRVHESELGVLTDVMEQKPGKLSEAMDPLQSSGLLLKRGPFYEVHPPVFAQFLASRALASERLRLFQLVLKLTAAARVRLFRRLAELPHSEELLQFWNEILDGLFQDLGSLAASGHLLPIVAEAAPEQTLASLKKVLQPLSVEARKSILGEDRLVYALESLLMRRTTATGAARLLLLLAETENETRDNSVTELFCEFFRPLHPQFSAGLGERLQILRDALEQGTETQQLVVIEAARRALGYWGSVRLRRSEGFVPGDRPAATYEELYDYGVGLVKLLMAAGNGPRAPVAAAARNGLPEVAMHVAWTPRADVALEAFRQCLDWLREEKDGLEPAWFVENLTETLTHWETQKGKDHPLVQDGHRILSEIEGLGFAQRLKRWSGERGSELWDETQKQLRALAQQVVDDPQLLTEGLFAWLLENSRGWLFFLFLGEGDQKRVLLPVFEAKAGQTSGARAFRFYCAGWAKTDPPDLAAYLEGVAERPLCGEAMLYAAEALPGDRRAVRVILSLIEKSGIPSQVAGVLDDSRWIDSLAPTDFLELLRALAGSSMENSAEAIYVLAAWLDTGRPLEGDLAEFAWRCLEANVPIAPKSPERATDAWHRDQLAAALATKEPDRGFRLLERLLESELEKGWHPLDWDLKLKFWQTLLNADRRRALESLFQGSTRLFIEWPEHAVFDQRVDAPVLLEIASRDTKAAVRVAGILDFDRPGGWEIACSIAACYPSEEDVQDALNFAILYSSFIGSPVERYARRRSEVERLLQDPNTPAAAKAWLRKLESHLKNEMGAEAIWDYDLDARDLKRFVDDPKAPERLWAIGRILKYAKWEDVQKLLSVKDIEDALPLIDLPESHRRALESAVQSWKRRA